MISKRTLRLLSNDNSLRKRVTIKGLQVIIYGADHAVYDTASLVQISGRVGRKKEESDGEVIFIVTKRMRQSKQQLVILKKNAYLQSVLQRKAT